MLIGGITDILGYPGWTAGATVLALIAIVVTIAIFRRSRQHKALGYSVTSTPVVSIDSAAKNKVKVSFEGKQVDQVHLLRLTISNLGTLPILEEDFNRPLVLTLGPSATPFFTEIDDAFPEDLAPQANPSGASIELAPLLLNPGDRFTLSSLISNFDGKFTVEGRIAGVSEIRNTPIDGRRTTIVERMFGRSRSDFYERASGAAFSAFLAITGIVAILGLAAALIPGLDKSGSTVSLRSGKSYCGKVLRVDSTSLILKQKSDDRIRTIPSDQLVSIKDQNC